MLRQTLARILAEFPQARTQPFASHPTVAFLTGPARHSVAQALAATAPHMKVVGSAGKGNFATVPWLAVFDPLVTTTATQGYYVVYLFQADTSTVYLSLNQGTTAIRAEFKQQTSTVLRERAASMRTRLRDFITQARFEEGPILLGPTTKNLPKDYEAGHAFGRAYRLAALPSEEELQADLVAMVQAYQALTFREGLDLPTEWPVGAASQAALSDAQMIIETRRYSYHKRIERNAKGARLAKQLHGTVCQACCFDFAHHYGAIGEGFIEAHHLQPLYQLAENTAVAYDVATQFAVLCSNCHRMIHRTADPSDLAGFKALLQETFCASQ